MRLRFFFKYLEGNAHVNTFLLVVSLCACVSSGTDGDGWLQPCESTPVVTDFGPKDLYCASSDTIGNCQDPAEMICGACNHPGNAFDDAWRGQVESGTVWNVKGGSECSFVEVDTVRADDPDKPSLINGIYFRQSGNPNVDAKNVSVWSREEHSGQWEHVKDFSVSEGTLSTGHRDVSLSFDEEYPVRYWKIQFCSSGLSNDTLLIVEIGFNGTCPVCCPFPLPCNHVLLCCTGTSGNRHVGT